MSKYVKFAALVLFISLLTGCFGTPSLSVSISPDPIVFTFGEYSQDVTFNFRTKGFGNLKLDTLVLELFDDEEELVWNDEVELDESTFVIPGVSHQEKEAVSLPSDLQYATEEIYDEELKGKTYLLRVTITGGKEVTTTADVKFE